MLVLMTMNSWTPRWTIDADDNDHLGEQGWLSSLRCFPSLNESSPLPSLGCPEEWMKRLWQKGANLLRHHYNDPDWPWCQDPCFVKENIKMCKDGLSWENMSCPDFALCFWCLPRKERDLAINQSRLLWNNTQPILLASTSTDGRDGLHDSWHLSR